MVRHERRHSRQARFVRLEDDIALEFKLKGGNKSVVEESAAQQHTSSSILDATVACLEGVSRLCERGLALLDPKPDQVTLWEGTACRGDEAPSSATEQRLLMMRGSAWMGRMPMLRIERCTPAVHGVAWDGNGFRRQSGTSSSDVCQRAVSHVLQRLVPVAVDYSALFVAEFASVPKFAQSLRRQGMPIFGLNLGWQEGRLLRQQPDEQRIEAAAQCGAPRYRHRSPAASLFCDWTMESSALLR